MSEITAREAKYRRLSVILIILISVFWLTMMSILIYDKVVLEYRKRNAIDYSGLFDKQRIHNQSTMIIYLDDTRLGHSTTTIEELADGGRIIKGETLINLKLPLLTGAFAIDSRIHITPARSLEKFSLDVDLPVKGVDTIRVNGRAEGPVLKIEIPELGITEEMPLLDTLISGNISPFSDIVHMRVGREWEVGLFDPIMRRVKKLRVKVVAQEEITVNPGTEKERIETVFRLESYDENGRRAAVAWVDEYGKLLEQRIEFMGMTLRMRAHD